MEQTRTLKFILMILLTTGFAAAASGEYLFLKDGSILKGTITGETADRIIYNDEQSKKQFVKRQAVSRVLFTSLSLTKIYIQMKDGRNFAAFIVDEDRDSYTIRKDLYKPDEIIIKRSEVMFTTERNPSGLKGDAGMFSIKLRWFPPFEKMEEYRVYIKKKNGEYKLAASVKTAAFELKKISSNTEYTIKVTALDAENVETPPTNELIIKTKNRPPESPGGLNYTKNQSGGLTLEWAPSIDHDGLIIKYEVYGSIAGVRKLLAETGSVSHVLKDPERYDGILVAAVDDMGGKSGFTMISLKTNLVFSITPSLMAPLGKFREMVDAGCGGTVSFHLRHVFLENFNAGIIGGFYYLPGRDVIDERAQKYQRIMIMPLLVQAKYGFYLTEYLTVFPVLSAGGAYILADYANRERVNLQLVDKKIEKRFFDPLLRAGIEAEYFVSGNYFFSVSMFYGTFIEKDGMISFLQYGVSAGYRY